MKKRLLCLGLVVVVSQLFATGCHPIQRWRANHPCGAGCGPCHACGNWGAEKHPLLHPVQTRRAALGGAAVAGPVGPVITNTPCHGCGGGGPIVPGYPVGFSGSPGAPLPAMAAPAGGYPPIGYPMPITPGPTVVPSHELPNPMPLPKSGTKP